MATDRHVSIQFNHRFLILILLALIVIQLISPFKGWMILIVTLGGAWIISYLWIRSLADGLSLNREMRFGWVQVGDRLQERFTLVNNGWAPALWITILDHSNMPGYDSTSVRVISRFGQISWKSHGVCQRRGLYRLGPTSLEWSDPFGFYTLRIRFDASTTMLVTPPIVPLPSINIAPGSRVGDGRSSATVLERTVIASSIRQFAPGDEMRRIHWPKTLRHEVPFVRVFESIPESDWWLILDLNEEVQVGSEEKATDEQGIIIAASMLDRGMRAGKAVGLLTHGERLARLPPAFGVDQMRGILRELALIENGKVSLKDLLSGLSYKLGRRTSACIITPDVGGKWIESLIRLARFDIVPTVLLLDPISYGGHNSAEPIASFLSSLGVAHHLITADMLDQPEARPGRRGMWEYKVTPLGRAIPRHDPGDLAWRQLE